MTTETYEMTVRPDSDVDYIDIREENESLQAEIDALRAENNRLKAKKTGTGLSMRVSPKGGLSIYGLGKWPITLYREQWLRLLAIAEQIRDFIVLHDSELATKGE